MKRVIVFISFLVAGMGLQNGLFATQPAPTQQARRMPTRAEVQDRITALQNAVRRRAARLEQRWQEGRKRGRQEAFGPLARLTWDAMQAVQQGLMLMRNRGEIRDQEYAFLQDEVARRIGNIERDARVANRRLTWHEQVVEMMELRQRRRGQRITRGFRQATGEVLQPLRDTANRLHQDAQQQLQGIQNNPQAFIDNLRAEVPGLHRAM